VHRAWLPACFAVLAFWILFPTLTSLCFQQHLCQPREVGGCQLGSGSGYHSLQETQPQCSHLLEDSTKFTASVKLSKMGGGKEPLKSESPDVVAVSTFTRRPSPACLEKRSCRLRCRGSRCLTDGERGKHKQICSELWKICNEGNLGPVCFYTNSALLLGALQWQKFESHYCRGKCGILVYVHPMMYAGEGLCW